MKKILQVLGVITLILAIILLTLLISRIISSGSNTDRGGISNIFLKSSEPSTDTNPLLSTEQEAALRAVGVDPATLPTSITPELQTCFEEKLGVERVKAIEGGSTITMTDFMKARSCVK